jgi:hypothetical protein
MAYDDTSTVEAKPVTDWVNDWDWLDPAWGPDAVEIFNAVREQCPVAMTERYGRAFMPVTMKAVAAIANATVNFSSEWVSVAQPDAPRRPRVRRREPAAEERPRIADEMRPANPAARPRA